MKKAVIPNINLADEFDWRNYNAVTPVKNQVSSTLINKFKGEKNNTLILF